MQNYDRKSQKLFHSGIDTYVRKIQGKKLNTIQEFRNEPSQVGLSSTKVDSSPLLSNLVKPSALVLCIQNILISKPMTMGELPWKLSNTMEAAIWNSNLIASLNFNLKEVLDGQKNLFFIVVQNLDKFICFRTY